MASVQRGRILEWANLIAVTGVAQVVVQAIGFISGILVIRLLPVHEYALYTLANTMLGTMTILADGGIAAGVMSEGGKVWQDRQKLGAVLATGMELRRKFAVFSLLVAVPILLFLLRRHDASWLMSVLIVLSLIPAFFTALSGTLLAIPAKLHQDIKPLQHFQVEANFVRLALIGLTMFAFPLAAVALLCAGGSQMWNNVRVRRMTLAHVNLNETVDLEVRARILAMVRNLLPASIYYCISGQLIIWIVSFFGSTAVIAQVGALSRFSAAMSVLQLVATTLLVPRFSRMRGDLRSSLRGFVAIEFVLIAMGLVIVGVCALAPGSLLKILGDGYEGLTGGLLLAVAGGCMQFVSVTTHQLLASRGMVVPAKWFIPLTIASQCAIIWFIRPHDLTSVLWLGFLSTVAVYFIRIGYLTREISRL